ncbi:MAG: T9SS type A sorting domain-containing protein [Bacteroidota bacterium]
MKSSLFFFTFLLFLASSSLAQTGVEFTVRLDASGTTYEAYMRSNTTWTPPFNITGTGQFSIKAPTGTLVVTNVQSNGAFPGFGDWVNNVFVPMPPENDTYDYFAFGLGGASRQYPYMPGQEVLLFTFNNALDCTAEIEVIDNLSDPFAVNQSSVNIGNSLTSFGSQMVNNGTGFANAWFGNYSPITSCPPLPLDLLSFTGEIVECLPKLYWVTENEVNVSHFNVERSRNGSDWEIVTAIEAIGGIGEPTTYSFQDDIGASKLYYRLKSVDLDGSFEYSPVIALESDCEIHGGLFDIYPNPVSDELTFVFDSHREGTIKFLVFDDLGRKVIETDRSLVEGFNKYEIDTRRLANGVYFIQPFINNLRLTIERFVKVEK